MNGTAGCAIYTHTASYNIDVSFPLLNITPDYFHSWQQLQLRPKLTYIHTNIMVMFLCSELSILGQNVGADTTTSIAMEVHNQVTYE